jgi:2-dehydro-3-deoxyphosphogluconate aldolase/(4S)-4-hydroxy-2-oxoglutarate aldolase
MNIEKFKKDPILGILRGITSDDLDPLIETICSSGLKTIEITMNTPDAAALIQKTIKIAKNRLTIGAGTVTDMSTYNNALQAGATFVVMPVLIKEVIKKCVKDRIPVFPGALTPQEIFNAWHAGATMVKVFPSGFFGPAYMKEIKAPFKDIKLLACGGVTADNMNDFFLNGASAISFGASVFKKEWLAQGKFSSIAAAIKKFTDKKLKIPSAS